MSRGYPAESVKELHEGLSGSVVELAAFGKRDTKLAHLGTGVIVCCASGCIGIITTVCCDPEDYQVLAGFGGQKNLKTNVLMRGRLLSGLVIHGYDGGAKAVPVTSDKFVKNPDRSEPVWTPGCFGTNFDEVMPSGSICVCNITKRTRNQQQVETFVHSCPIGDGLIGAPVVNRFGKILGMNIARSPESSNVNFGMRFEELKKELAELADGANSEEESMSSLLGKFSRTLLGRLAKMSDAGSPSKKAKRTDDAGSSSSKKARMT